MYFDQLPVVHTLCIPSSYWVRIRIYHFMKTYTSQYRVLFRLQDIQHYASCTSHKITNPLQPPLYLCDVIFECFSQRLFFNFQVVMKLIKHCHEVDLANLGIAQGALLGLVTDTRLEITHCFPFPSASDETFSDEDFQLDMMRRLRYVAQNCLPPMPSNVIIACFGLFFRPGFT